jgi:hypothetical protein
MDVFLHELGRPVSWHLHEKSVQRAVQTALRRAGIEKGGHRCYGYRQPARRRRRTGIDAAAEAE